MVLLGPMKTCRKPGVSFYGYLGKPPARARRRRRPVTARPRQTGRKHRLTARQSAPVTHPLPNLSHALKKIG